MTRKILGLDIQDNAVSAILLGSGIKGTTIEAHDYVPFAKESADGSGLTSALEVITQKIDIAGTSCVVSLPANLIFCRNLKIPFKGKKKIAKILPYEIEPTLPLPIDDLIIDFDVIKRVEYTEHTDIIAAAMETSNLQSYLDTLSKFHIDPEVVTVSGYSTALCINNLIDENKKWLLLDIGDTQVTMFIGFAGDIRLLRSFSIPEDDTPDAGERFCTGIHQTISAFEDTIDQNFQPDQIFFTGSRRDAPVFEGQLATILETPIKQMDLVRDTESIKVFSAEPSRSSRRTDGAFALALMGIQGSNGLNFRKGPFAAKNFWQEHKKNLIKTGLLVTVVAVLALSNLVLDSYLMKQKIHRLDDQIAEIMTSTFPDVKKIVDPLQQMRTKMQQLSGNAFLPKETHRAIPTVDILRDISRLVPKTADVNLTRMVIDTDSVVISGTTDTYKSVDIIKNSLEQVEFFRKIVISSANIDKSDNRVQFKLKIDF